MDYGSININVIYWLKSISYCTVRLVMKAIIDEGLKFLRINTKTSSFSFTPNNDVCRLVEMPVLSQKEELCIE